MIIDEYMIAFARKYRLRWLLKYTQVKCAVNVSDEICLKDFSATGGGGSEEQMIKEIMISERILLQTIKFDLQCEHPYGYLLKSPTGSTRRRPLNSSSTSRTGGISSCRTSVSTFSRTSATRCSTWTPHSRPSSRRSSRCSSNNNNSNKIRPQSKLQVKQMFTFLIHITSMIIKRNNNTCYNLQTSG